MPKPSIPRLEQRYVRFVRTATFSRVLDGLPDSRVLGCRAWRSWEENIHRTTPLPYLRSSDSRRYSLQVSYNSFLASVPFNKGVILEYLDSTGAADATIRELAVLCTEGVGRIIGGLVAEALDDPAYRSIARWIVLLDHHPCSQDGEGFAERVKIWHEGLTPSWSDHEGRLGLDPAVLDFACVVPLPIWRTLARRKRISEAYRETIENWKAYSVSNEALIRTAVKDTFPDGLTDGRTYRRTKGDTWEIVRYDEAV